MFLWKNLCREIWDDFLHTLPVLYQNGNRTHWFTPDVPKQVHKDQKHNRMDMQRSIETCHLFLHWVKVMNREEASHVPVLFLRQHSRLMCLPVRKGLNKDVQVHKHHKHNRTDMQRSIELPSFSSLGKSDEQGRSESCTSSFSSTTQRTHASSSAKRTEQGCTSTQASQTQLHGHATFAVDRDLQSFSSLGKSDEQGRSESCTSSFSSTTKPTDASPVRKGLNREVWRSQCQTFPQILPHMVLLAKPHTDIFRQLKKRNPKTVRVPSLDTTS